MMSSLLFICIYGKRTVRSNQLAYIGSILKITFLEQISTGTCLPTMHHGIIVCRGFLIIYIYIYILVWNLLNNASKSAILIHTGNIHAATLSLCAPYFINPMNPHEYCRLLPLSSAYLSTTLAILNWWTCWFLLQC